MGDYLETSWGWMMGYKKVRVSGQSIYVPKDDPDLDAAIELIVAHEAAEAAAMEAAREALVAAGAGEGLGRPASGEVSLGAMRFDFYGAPGEGALPGIDWLVGGLLARGSVTLFVGGAGTKKTYSLLDLAVCVARGAAWLGREVQQGAVLVVDEESGQARTQRRLAELFAGHGVAGDEALPVWALSYAGWNLMRREDAVRLAEAIRRVDARLVIIDALAGVMPGGDENVVRDTALVFQGLRYAAEATGAAVCVIHHANKRGVYRGSSHLKGAVDTMVMMESAPDSERLTFRLAKTRDRRGETFGARMCFETDEAGAVLGVRLRRGDVTRLSKAALWVLATLGEEGMLSLYHLGLVGSKLGHSMDWGKKGVYELVEAGYAQRSNEGERGTFAFYGLTEAGVVAWERGRGEVG